MSSEFKALLRNTFMAVSLVAVFLYFVLGGSSETITKDEHITSIDNQLEVESSKKGRTPSSSRSKSVDRKINIKED